MSYTKDRPPVIKHNFGSDAWPGITGANPPTVVITDQAGVVQAVDTGVMTQIPGTPMWYYAVGDRVTAGIPETAAEWTYYVTAGSGGNLVADGNLEIQSNSVAVTEYSINTHRLMIPSAVQLPASVGAPKVLPIQFVAYSASGDIVTLDSVSITIGTAVVAAAMTSSAGIWQYDWTLNYSDTPQIHEVTVDATVNSETTTFPAVIETFKPNEFDPVRLGSGLVV